MANHIEKLSELIPSGDGYNSDYAHTLVNAIAYMRELEKDKKRIDWLADKDNVIGNVQLPKECVVNNISSLRNAIDDAMLTNLQGGSYGKRKT